MRDAHTKRRREDMGVGNLRTGITRVWTGASSVSI